MSVAIALVCCAVVAQTAAAAEAASPRITRAIKSVTLLPAQGSPRPARVSDTVADGTTLRAGAGARAELTFGNRGVVRLGGNTILQPAGQAQNLTLHEGAVLFQVPRESANAKIATAGINVEIRGTSGLIERYGAAYVKILVLEGTARVYLNRIGESVLVNAGEMLIMKPNATTLPEAVNFDIGHLYKTSLLMNSDFPPLASRERIEKEIQRQRSDPDYIRTNLVIYGRGTLVNLVEPTPEPAGAPKPGKPSNGNVTPNARSKR